MVLNTFYTYTPPPYHPSYLSHRPAVPCSTPPISIHCHKIIKHAALRPRHRFPNTTIINKAGVNELVSVLLCTIVRLERHCLLQAFRLVRTISSSTRHWSIECTVRVIEPAGSALSSLRRGEIGRRLVYGLLHRSSESRTLASTVNVRSLSPWTSLKPINTSTRQPSTTNRSYRFHHSPISLIHLLTSSLLFQPLVT